MSGRMFKWNIDANSPVNCLHALFVNVTMQISGGTCTIYKINWTSFPPSCDFAVLTARTKLI